MSEFTAFIYSLIDSFDCLPGGISLSLKEGIGEYRKAFTVGDYEVLEQIGDAVIGHFIISYSYEKFPFLNSKEGVKVVARVRINYTSCQFLAGIAQDLGFWDHIIGKDDVALQEPRRLNLLEDVFEAFIGATHIIIDKEVGQGMGFIICNLILTSIYNKRNISLRYESLFDAKTRLKELCDFFKKRLVITCAYEKDESEYTVKLTTKVEGKLYRFEATSRVKIDAEQQVSLEAIDALRKEGVYKEIPDFFQFIYTQMS